MTNKKVEISMDTDSKPPEAITIIQRADIVEITGHLTDL